MSKLYRVERGHYCGPSSLAAITGESGEAMEVEINFGRRDPLLKVVKGCVFVDLRRVLVARGYVLHIIRLPAKRPLTLLDVRERLGWSNVYLIETKRHFMVVRDGLVVDTETPAGMALEKHPNRLRHIERIAMVHAPKADERKWLIGQLDAAIKG